MRLASAHERSVSRPREALGSLVAGSLALVLVSSGARAQDAPALESGANDAARRQLIELAQQAARDNNPTRALELAQRAGQLEMSASLRFFIAHQEAALGRIADAFGNADRCAREAEGGQVVRNRAQIVRQCRELAAELSRRVARVAVQVPSPAPAGLVVSVGGTTLLSAFYGVPYPVSPGRLRITATAEGFAPFERTIELAEGGASVVPIELRRAEPVTPPTSGGAVGASGAGSITPPPGDGGLRGETPASGPGVGPWVLVGVGGAALVTGGVFYGLTASHLGMCPMGACPDQATVARAQTYEVVALTSVTVGAAAVAGGLLWRFLAPRRSSTASTAARVELRPIASGYVAGAGVAGAF